MTLTEDAGPLSREEVETEPEKAKTNDVEAALVETGHQVHEYKNGLTVGLRLAGVPGKRGVHADIVYVLDLREARFGRTPLAMKAAVLESLGRPLQSVLYDIGLGDRLTDLSMFTVWGRVSLPALRSKSESGSSMVHETRTVYAIVNDARPSKDLSWLTDGSRIMTIDEFTSNRTSDTRSTLAELQNSIGSEKWDTMQKVMKMGWFAILSVIMAVSGMLGIIMVTLQGTGSLLFPLASLGLGVPISVLLLLNSRRNFNEFRAMTSKEESDLLEVGDGRRLMESQHENEESTALIMDLSFVLSPLVASAAAAIESGDMKEVAQNLSSVLDECVRLSPTLSDSVSGDKGLMRFIGLFERLGPLSDDDMKGNLPMAYTELTVKTDDTEEKMIQNLGVINQALFDIGVLRLDVKDNVDDMLNSRSGKAALRMLDEELSEPEEPIEVTRLEPTEEEEPPILKAIEESDVEDEADVDAPIEEEVVLVATTVAEERPEKEPEPPTDVEEVAPESVTPEVVTSKGKRRRRRSADPTSHLKVRRGRKKEAEGVGA